MVVSFAHDKRLDEIYGDERKQILALFDEISTIYKNAMNRKWDGRCDICGKGDRNEIFRISNVVKGYENRINSSPILCWSHARGWNQGLESKQIDSMLAKCPESDRWKIARYAHAQKMFDKYSLSNEEVDLYFAEYLTKQLFKVAQNQAKGEVK